MFSICKTTHPATGVEHVLSCNFFNQSMKSLVVAGANIIRIFQLIPDVDLTRKNYQYNDNNPPKMKLECLAQYVLFGNIMSVQSVSLANSSRDALILGFKEAKFSIVEYDPDSHDLRTLSLHYFEEDEIKDGWSSNYDIPMVRVDPESRCAAMLVYGRRLVILPFRVDTMLEESESSFQEADDVENSSQVLPSYTIVLKAIDEKIENVIDVQFLHGYYEPTVLILYEPVRTFSGRLAVRKDTCAMITISLNIQQQVHPVIWSLNNLPYDCVKAVAVNKPIGGVLIFAVNSLIYLNQSVPPYGVALNSLAESTTNFPLKTQDDVKLTLDCSQTSFISHDRLVISVKTGELYVLTLQADSMRSVRSFHFEKSAASVLTTCTCVFEDNYLFLGSRLGNSLLLRFSTKEQVPAATVAEEKATSSEQPSKKKKLDTLGDWMASNVSDIRDVDELEVYGNERQSSVIRITSFVFEVCDSLLNVGPCGNVSMGEPAFLSEEFSNNSDPDVEVVTTSGYGKNGALCILQRTVRPQVVTTFELPGYIDMWTVVGCTSVDEQHAFMILSQEDSTMILQTGREINELDQSGFSTQGPTIFAGNLGNNKYILQVTQMGVRLLQGSEQVQHIPLDLGSPLIHASAADPHVVILTEDGQLILLTLREIKQGVSRLTVQRPTNFALRPQIMTLCIHRDVSGLFSHSIPDAERRFHGIKKEKNLIMAMKGDIEDEDELLYGESGPQTDIISQSAFELLSSQYRGTSWWKKYMHPIKPTYWLFLTRENGHFEIYSIPDFQLSYLVTAVGTGLPVLADSLNATPVVAQQAQQTQTTSPSTETEVKEILAVSLGHHGRRPLLLIRLADEILIYQAYRYPKGFLKIRFKKITTLLTRNTHCRSRSADHTLPSLDVCQLRYFHNIANYNGVFICGYNPHWLFLTSRGEFRMHPMYIDGPVQCFAQFHNVNCPQGFLYFNCKNELRISVLPIHLSYDAAWPVRKVPLRCTPHFITYHLESKTYCIALSQQRYTNVYFKFNGEDKEITVEEKDEKFPLPFKDFFSIVLFSPVSWEVIPNTKTDMEDWEHVTCLKTVSLAYEGTRSGLRGYVCVGTNFNYSEDITSRGRIIIYDIIDVVPEPGQPLTKNKMKVMYAKEQKGPVTAITNTQSGFLVTAVGQKIYIWQLKDNDLAGIAFIDTQIYAHRLLSAKSLILVADVYKSITLLRFQEEFRTLSLVGRGFRPTQVYSIDFIIDNTQMGFVISDQEQNIIVYKYQPEARESLGGQRLLRKADFHLGQSVNSFFRICCKKSTLSEERREQLNSNKRHITMFATLDGALGYVMPIPEKNYRRLLMLQNALNSHVPHTAGLNPKAFRTYKSARKMLGNFARGILDGELIWMFVTLTTNERDEIAKKIGVKPDDILEDLYEMHMLSAHF